MKKTKTILIFSSSAFSLSVRGSASVLIYLFSNNVWGVKDALFMALHCSLGASIKPVLIIFNNFRNERRADGNYAFRRLNFRPKSQHGVWSVVEKNLTLRVRAVGHHKSAEITIIHVAVQHHRNQANKKIRTVERC